MFYWKGDNGNGKIKTIDVKENESITQQIIKNNSTSEVIWTFKDTPKATKVICRINHPRASISLQTIIRIY